MQVQRGNWSAAHDNRPNWMRRLLLFPMLAGALVMVGVAVLYRRVCRRPYPSCWY